MGQKIKFIESTEWRFQNIDFQQIDDVLDVGCGGGEDKLYCFNAVEMYKNVNLVKFVCQKDWLK